MLIYKPVFSIFLSVYLLAMAAAQQKPAESDKFLFKKIKTRLTVAEKKHLFQQLSIKWSKNKERFIDNDDINEVTPYTAVNFFSVDINKDGVEEVFIVLINPALFEKTGVQIILFSKDQDGSYQKNTEIPAEDMVPLSRKHLGYPDMLLSSSDTEFIIWRWNGKRYKFFQKVTGPQLPDGPNKGLGEISKAYQGSLKNWQLPSFSDTC